LPPGSRHRSAEQRKKKRAKYDHHIQKEKGKRKRRKEVKKTKDGVDDELYSLRFVMLYDSSI